MPVTDDGRRYMLFAFHVPHTEMKLDFWGNPVWPWFITRMCCDEARKLLDVEPRGTA